MHFGTAGLCPAWISPSARCSLASMAAMSTIVNSSALPASLAGLFLVTTVITRYISDTSSALVSESGISTLRMMMGTPRGERVFLPRFANDVSWMVYGPGGYRFGDFCKLGLPVTIVALIATLIVLPTGDFDAIPTREREGKRAMWCLRL